MLDENDCATCEEVLHELERIDDEADDLEIMFVKIRDTRYAKKYGITTVPTLVFFRKKFPSVYRGEFDATLLHLYHLQRDARGMCARNMYCLERSECTKQRREC